MEIIGTAAPTARDGVEQAVGIVAGQTGVQLVVDKTRSDHANANFRYFHYGVDNDPDILKSQRQRRFWRRHGVPNRGGVGRSVPRCLAFALAGGGRRRSGPPRIEVAATSSNDFAAEVNGDMDRGVLVEEASEDHVASDGRRVGSLADRSFDAIRTRLRREV